MTRTRVRTAALLLIGFVAVFALLDAGWFGWAAMCVAALAALEWGRLCYPGRPRRQAVYAAAVTLVMACGWTLIPDLGCYLLLAGAALWLLAPVLLWWWKKPRRAARVAPLVGLLVIAPAFFAVAALRVLDAAGAGYFLWVMLLVVWTADVGSYYVGGAFGRNRLSPGISPSKTWEGVIGGLAAVALLSLVLSSSALRLGYPGAEPPPLVPWLGVCLATAVFSVFGDLLESVFKRMAGVKDSGSILPGHGGVLDRIDGVTAAAPMFLLLVFVTGLSGAPAPDFRFAF